MQALLQNDNGLLCHGPVMPSRFILKTSVDFSRQIFDYQCRHKYPRYF